MCLRDENLDLITPCWDHTQLGCEVGAPPCIFHHHHTACNKAWGWTWEYVPAPDEDFSGEKLEEYIKSLLDSIEDTGPE